MATQWTDLNFSNVFLAHNISAVVGAGNVLKHEHGMIYSSKNKTKMYGLSVFRTEDDIENITLQFYSLFLLCKG